MEPRWAFFKRGTPLPQRPCLAGWTSIGEPTHVARVLRQGRYHYGYLDRNVGHFVDGDRVLCLREVELLVGPRFFWVPQNVTYNELPKNVKLLKVEESENGKRCVFLGQAVCQGELLSGPISKEYCYVPTKGGVKTVYPTNVLAVLNRGQCGRCGEQLEAVNQFYHHVNRKDGSRSPHCTRNCSSAPSNSALEEPEMDFKGYDLQHVELLLEEEDLGTEFPAIFDSVEMEVDVKIKSDRDDD